MTALNSLRLRLLIIAAAIVTALAGGLILFGDSLFRMSIRPPGDESRAPAPGRPDYAQADAWALRPQHLPPGGWESPWGVDVFFIHPTSVYDNTAWNAPITSSAGRRRLIDRLLPNHAGPFAAAGPVYAPLYRQAALYAMIEPAGESGGAMEVAYADILRAFDHYMETDNRGRGVMIAGVGQGGVHALRLLRDRFQQDPLRERLAAAYIIEAPVPVDPASAGLSQTACTSPAQLHCIVSWKTVLAGEAADRRRYLDRAPIWRTSGALEELKGETPLCVNPMLWTTGNALAPKLDHRGGARVTSADGDAPRLVPQAVSARCNDGVLDVEPPSQPELRPANGWGDRYRTPEFNLFYADIAANAAERSRAASIWMPDNARRPAKPLPPPFPLPDNPIHRPTGVPDPVQ